MWFCLEPGVAAFVKSERWWFGLTPGSIRGVFFTHAIIYYITVWISPKSVKSKSKVLSCPSSTNTMKNGRWKTRRNFTTNGQKMIYGVPKPPVGFYLESYFVFFLVYLEDAGVWFVRSFIFSSCLYPWCHNRIKTGAVMNVINYDLWFEKAYDLTCKMVS